jgi:hypothetical protein
MTKEICDFRFGICDWTATASREPRRSHNHAQFLRFLSQRNAGFAAERSSPPFVEIWCPDRKSQI